MVKIEMTKDEFEMLTEWAREHFWDNTQSFEGDVNVDECLLWARSCLLMARLKNIADKNGIYFGFNSPYEEDDDNSVKIDYVTKEIEERVND